MTPSEYKKLKLKKLEDAKAKPHQRISNNFIDNAINKNNLNAIKTVFYLASILDEFNFDKKIDTLQIDLRKMFKYTEMTAQEIRNNLKAMQETSITFINEKEEWEEHIVLIPRIEFLYGKNIVKVDIYSKIAKLIVDVKQNYTPINTKTLMTLKSKYSIRLLPLLNTISRYDEGFKQIRKFDLESINEFFGTRYKTFTDVKRKILDIAKEELDNNSSLSFNYEINTEKLGQGRPKATSVTIKPISKNNYQSTIFTNFDESAKSQPYKETATAEELRIKKIREWQPNLKELELDVEYGIAQQKEQNIKDEFELYVNEQIAVFKKLCIENKIKYNKDNLDISFKRHIEGAFNHRIDFFSKKIFNTKYN